MPAGGGDGEADHVRRGLQHRSGDLARRQKVAYVGRSQGGFDIYVCNVDGHGTVRITQDMGDNEDPTWSPDSKYLVFSSTRLGRSELFISTADGRHQTRITNTGGWTQPAFVPARAGAPGP